MSDFGKIMLTIAVLVVGGGITLAMYADDGPDMETLLLCALVAALAYATCGGRLWRQA